MAHGDGTKKAYTELPFQVQTELCKFRMLQLCIYEDSEFQITYAKKGDLHNRRLASAYVKEKAALVKLFEILGPRYSERNGGYTRVMKIAQPRLNDSAKMSFIEFVDREGELRTPKTGSGSTAENATKSLRNKGKNTPVAEEE